MVSDLFQPGAFWEVYVSCPIEVCISRDPKGLYKKAAAGEISDFTGISSPYEAPLAPELVVQSDKYSAKECAAQIISFMIEKKILDQ